MAEITGTIKDAENKIKLNQIDPYVAIIGPYKTSVDFGKLKSYGVSAMMFCAGGLYDASHKKKKQYKNPYLDDQVKRCLSAKMPYGLYAEVRAHNEIEADAECLALYYILADDPPKYGIWLRMLTGSKSKTVNDKILDRYYKYITTWGFRLKCGIYIEKDKLNTISWENYEDKFYLLAIDRMTNFKSVEDKLLKPEMFDIPDGNS